MKGSSTRPPLASAPGMQGARPPALAFKTALKNSQPFASLVFLQFAGARRDSRQAAEEYILLLLEPGRRRPLTRRMYGSVLYVSTRTLLLVLSHCS